MHPFDGMHPCLHPALWARVRVHARAEGGGAQWACPWDPNGLAEGDQAHPAQLL